MLSGLTGMARNTIIPYNPHLKERAKELRKNSTLGEILLWKEIRKRRLGVQFHRQVPIDNFIIDFYCHELMLAIEVDGKSHDSLAAQIKDFARDYRLEQLGVKVIRVNDRDVKQDLDSVVRYLQFKVDQELKREHPPS